MQQQRKWITDARVSRSILRQMSWQEVDEFLEEFRVLDMNEDGEEANDDSETEDVVIEMDRNQNEDDEIEDEPNTSEVMDEDGNETDDDVDESDEQNDNDSDIDVE